MSDQPPIPPSSDRGPWNSASEPEPRGPAYDLPPPPVSGIDDWQRLSPRVIVLYPIISLGQLIIPLAIVFFGFGRGGDGSFLAGPGFAIVGVALAVVVGLVPWLTTRYRITQTQLQVRRGVLNRKVLTAPLDRVRSVDLEAGPVHRILGLSKVAIGTGVDSSRIDLNALSVPQAGRLQDYLLARKRGLAARSGPLSAGAVPPAARPSGAPAYPHTDLAGMPTTGEQDQRAEVELARIDWSWLKYAPFSLASLVVVAGVATFFWQIVGDIPFEEQFSSAQGAWDWVLGQAVVILVAIVSIVVILGWLLLSTVTYVIAWWNLRLTRMGEGTLRLVRGLITTNSTTVEESKIRGVTMTEPALLRVVKGAELVTISTGVGDGGQTKVLPPCPRDVAVRVGHDVLEEEGPLTDTLHQHGPYARRRCHVRAQWGTLFFTAASLAASTFVDLPPWLPVLVFLGWATVALGLAEAAYRNLGHGLTDQHVMSGHGVLGRTREVLEQAGVIGWVIRQSYFQRRVGLATLVATTAAGSESVRIHDIPLEQAIAMARAATPEPFAQFPVAT
ncbi:MAG: PH domain-containing protein [Ornithinimicrobium sp.]